MWSSESDLGLHAWSTDTKPPPQVLSIHLMQCQLEQTQFCLGNEGVILIRFSLCTLSLHTFIRHCDGPVHGNKLLHFNWTFCIPDWPHNLKGSVGIKNTEPSSKNYYEFSRWWENLLKSSALSSEELAWGWSHQAGELGQAGVIIAFSVLWRWEGDLFLSMKMILTWPRWFHPFQLCLKKKKAHNRKSYTRKLFVIHTCCKTVAVLGDLQSLNLYLIIESYSF